MGFVSALCEMLVQSHVSGVLSLLPALPSSIAEAGRVSGLAARGGVTVSIIWDKKAVTTAVLHFEGPHPWYAPRQGGGSGLVEETPGYFRWPSGWERSAESVIAVLSPNALRVLTSKQQTAAAPGGRKSKKTKKISKIYTETIGASCADGMGAMHPTIEADPARNKLGMYLRVMSFPCTITLCNAATPSARCVEKVRQIT